MQYTRGDALPALATIHEGLCEDVSEGDLLAVVDGFYVVGVGVPAGEDDAGNFSWTHDSLRKVRSN